ncbi:unnamed protein product [Adineta ricciae]|uniref:Uncharacterized protein n=1 Tax=Adineta ricciae TaxID=249248 RepID=A0A815MKS7_ADIRI|nr:unnamed protein product [Adineta ricciae]
MAIFNNKSTLWNTGHSEFDDSDSEDGTSSQDARKLIVGIAVIQETVDFYARNLHRTLPWLLHINISSMHRYFHHTNQSDLSKQKR